MKRNTFVFVPSLFLVLLAAGSLVYSYFLPRYIETSILPGLGKQLATPLTGKVSSIGLHTADIGDIVLGEETKSALRIGSIHVEYSLSALLAKKVDRIRISGLRLNLEVADDGSLVIPGVSLENLTAKEKTAQVVQQSPAISLPVELGDLQVNNGLLNIRYGNRHFFVPFDLQSRKQKKNEIGSLPAYLITLQVFPLDQEIVATGTIDLQKNIGMFAFAAETLDTRSIAGLFTEDADVPHIIGGITGTATVKLSPFELVAGRLDGDVKPFQYGSIPVSLGGAPEARPGKSPIHLDIERAEEKWLVHGQFSLLEPIQGEATLNGTASRDNSGFTGNGMIELRFADTVATDAEPLAVKLTGSPEIQGDFAFGIEPSSVWQVKFESAQPVNVAGTSRSFTIQYGETRAEAGFPAFTIVGEGTAGAGQIKATLTLPEVRVHTGTVHMRFPEIQGEALLLSNTASGFQARGKLSIADAVLDDAVSGVKIDGIDSQIPFHWPLAKQESTGHLKVEKITWKKNKLGSFASVVTLKEATYILEGKYNSILPRGIVTDVAGRAEIDPAGFSGELKAHADLTPFGSVNLGMFDPSLDKSYLNGELGLDVFFNYGGGVGKGNMQLKLQNARYEMEEKKYTVDDIDLDIVLPSLPQLQTNPAQEILFEKASFGNLSFSKGKILWQLESTGSIFVEEGVVNWAGGRIFTNAVRVSPGKEDVVVPVFCDRLKLTEILQQFGVSNAEGEGTVSGRIPLHAGRDIIGFEDGFLYSSPGQGGSVKVSAFDLLAQGIPKNTPQFAQIDFAAEALKNFQYSWVKLLLNTEGENLVLQMQMDGKPVQSLPFRYDSQTGLLQRLEDGSRGIDQPIRLDVNFRLPLNRFLGYSGKIQELMKKIK